MPRTTRSKSQKVTRAEGTSFARYGHNMAPVRHEARFGATSPIFSYPYARSREALERLERDAPVDDWDGVKLRYVNPLTGGSPMPTMATFMQKLPAGFRGRPWRQTDGAVYSVVEGRGEAVIEGGGQQLALRFRAARSFRRPVMAHCAFRVGARLRAVQLFRPPGASGPGHPPRRKVVMSYVFTPLPLPSVPVVGRAERFPVRRIYCVGRNYEEHAKEMGFTGREPPFFFMKPADAVVPVNAGETGTMAYPSLTKNLHHEIELVVAIGTGGKNIKAADAQKHIFGYAVGLDMTRRDLQGEMKKQGRPWDIGKGFEQSAPIGPITPVAQAGDVTKAEIFLQVNGKDRQRSTRGQADLEHRRDRRAPFGGLGTAARRPDFHRHARGRGGGGGRGHAGGRRRGTGRVARPGRLSLCPGVMLE